MKRVQVLLDEDVHEERRRLAARKNSTMSALVRYAVDLSFEDELDAIAGEMGLEEHLRDPSSSISWEQYKLEQGLDQ
jgi:hypothetical protein